MISGKTFAEVVDEVRERASGRLPDRVVHMAKLQMTKEGHITGPDLPLMRLNSWSQRQLPADAEERAEEVTRRLSREPGEVKIRMERDDTDSGEAVARAFLGPNYEPIDDVRVFERLWDSVRALLEPYRFRATESTDSLTLYRATHLEVRPVNGDDLYPGWTLRNSEVGAAPLTLDDYWYRLVCTNGLMLKVNNKRALYRQHRPIDDLDLGATLATGLAMLPARWREGHSRLVEASEEYVEYPDSEILRALSGGGVPRALITEAQRQALQDQARSRFDVVQAITHTAHSHADTTPTLRYTMEERAGEYLMAA